MAGGGCVNTGLNVPPDDLLSSPPESPLKKVAVFGESISDLVGDCIESLTPLLLCCAVRLLILLFFLSSSAPSRRLLTSISSPVEGAELLIS